MKPKDITFEVESSYDSWGISTFENGEHVDHLWWDHGDSNQGVGGERLFATLLERLGYKVKFKEVF